MSAAQPDANPQLRFLPMRVQDVPQVTAIETVLYEFPWTSGNFCDSIQAGYKTILLLDQDNVLLGYGVLMFAVDEAHLLNLSIARQHQGRGLGSRLLQHLIEIAQQACLQRVILEVRPTNPRAADLYQRFGFKQIGVRKGYYPAHGGTREDALVMEKNI